MSRPFLCYFFVASTVPAFMLTINAEGTGRLYTAF